MTSCHPCRDRKVHTVLSKNRPSLFDPEYGLLGFVWPSPGVGFFGFPYDHALGLGLAYFNLLDLIPIHYFLIYSLTYLIFFCPSICLLICSLFINIFCIFWEFTENSKKREKFHTSPPCRLISHFGMNKAIFVFTFFFTSMHVLKLCVLNICDMF